VDAGHARLLVVAPLRIECCAVRRRLSGALVLRSGMGAARARSVALQAALAALGIARVHAGPLVSVDHIVHGRERAALAGEGALAADMESAWPAPAAAGKPFAVVRVVLDALARGIRRPPAALAGGLTAWRVLRRMAPALALWAAAQSSPPPRREPGARLRQGVPGETMTVSPTS